MFTSNHIQINWDGDENVEVNVPPTYQRKLCGLCGNYNNRPGDDWKVGPACAGEGAIVSFFYFIYSLINLILYLFDKDCRRRMAMNDFLQLLIYFMGIISCSISIIMIR